MDITIKKKNRGSRPEFIYGEAIPRFPEGKPHDYWQIRTLNWNSFLAQTIGCHFEFQFNRKREAEECEKRK